MYDLYHVSNLAENINNSPINLDSLFEKYFLKMINQIYMLSGNTDEEFIYWW